MYAQLWRLCWTVGFYFGLMSLLCLIVGDYYIDVLFISDFFRY